MKKILLKLLQTVGSFIFLPTFCNSAVLYGNVEKVIDGDTIDVKINIQLTKKSDLKKYYLNKDSVIRVRLYAIDSPELKEGKFSHFVKEYVEDVLLKKSVKIEVVSKDKYGRFVGIVWNKNINFNQHMLEEGFAFLDQRYLRRLYKKEFILAEHFAKTSKKGVWNPGNNISPKFY